MQGEGEGKVSGEIGGRDLIGAKTLGYLLRSQGFTLSSPGVPAGPGPRIRAGRPGPTGGVF